MRFLASVLLVLSLSLLLGIAGCQANEQSTPSSNPDKDKANQADPDPFHLHFPSFPSSLHYPFHHHSHHDIFDSLSAEMRSLRSSIAHQMAAVNAQMAAQRREMEKHFQQVWGEVGVRNPMEQFQAIHQIPNQNQQQHQPQAQNENQDKEKASISADPSSSPLVSKPEFIPSIHRSSSMSLSKVDLIERGDRYLINAELAGIPKEKISIHHENDIITIEGKNEQQKEEGGEKDKYHYRERSYSSIKRSFRIPSDVDPSTISAQYENGLLTIHLPKNKEAPKSPTPVPIQ